MAFYEILEALMLEKQMTIPDVARACGLSDSTIRSIIERKAKRVSLDVAFKMHEGLGVSLRRLNGDTDYLEEVPMSKTKQQLMDITSALDEDRAERLLELAQMYQETQGRNRDS